MNTQPPTGATPLAQLIHEKKTNFRIELRRRKLLKSFTRRRRKISKQKSKIQKAQKLEIALEQTKEACVEVKEAFA